MSADSVGKVVAEMLAEVNRASGVDQDFPMLDEDWITRLQALDRQRQEEVLPKSWWVDRLKQQEALTDAAITRAEAAEAALAEARGLLHETGRYLDPRHYAAQIAKLTAFLTRTAKEPSNA